MSGLHKWVPGSRRGEAVEPLRRLPVADVGHLRQRMSDPRPPQPPAPLRDWDETEGPAGRGHAGLGRPSVRRVAGAPGSVRGRGGECGCCGRVPRSK
jgi:hypothetical protein